MNKILLVIIWVACLYSFCFGIYYLGSLVVCRLPLWAFLPTMVLISASMFALFIFIGALAFEYLIRGKEDE